MDCRQAGELGTRVLSGNASPAETAEFQRHLLACLPCRGQHARLEKVWSLMGSLPSIAVAPARSRETLARISGGRSRRFAAVAGIAAAVLVAAAAFALFRPTETPTDVSRSTPGPAPTPRTPEPKRESVREEVERNRVEQLLEEEKVPQPVVEPVKAPAPVPAPPQVAVPAPVPPSPKTEPQPLPTPEPKAIVKEEAPAPRVPAPAPAVRETTAPAGTIDRAEGNVFLVVGGVKSAAKAGQPLPEGAGLETSGANSQAVLEYADGSRVALGADTVLSQVWDRHAPAEGKFIQVAQGVVAAQVARQPAAEPMIFVTPHAEARVLGTRLSLTVGASVTRLDVRQGRVKLTRREDGASAEVAEGRSASAGKGVTPVAKAAPAPKVILFESFDRSRWNPALAQGGETTTGLRFSTESGALSVLVAQKAPPEVTPSLVTTPGTPGGAKLPPDVSKKMVDSVTRGATTAPKGDLPRNLWLETRQTFALANETPLRLRTRLWQSTSDADRSAWIGINRTAAGQSLLLERRGNVLQLWSDATQTALWKKELPSIQEWESLEIWLTKDQIVIRRNDLTIHTGANPLKAKVVQLSIGGTAKAELAQDEEVRFDDLELSWTTKADLEDVTR